MRTKPHVHMCETLFLKVDINNAGEEDTNEEEEENRSSKQ